MLVDVTGRRASLVEHFGGVGVVDDPGYDWRRGVSSAVAGITIRSVPYPTHRSSGHVTSARSTQGIGRMTRDDSQFDSEGEPEHRLGAVLGQAHEHDLCVMDLPSLQHPRALSWWHACHDVALVVGTSIPQVADAMALVDQVRPRLSGVVIRSGAGRGRASDQVSSEVVAEMLGLPMLGLLAHDPGVGAALANSLVVGAVDGPVRQVAWEILAQVTQGVPARGDVA